MPISGRVSYVGENWRTWRKPTIIDIIERGNWIRRGNWKGNGFETCCCIFEGVEIPLHRSQALTGPFHANDLSPNYESNASSPR